MVRVTKLLTPAGGEVELGPLSGDLTFLARNLDILLRGEGHAARQSMGVDISMIGILGVVWLNPGISQNDLAATLALRKPSITKLVKRIEADGLLSRRRTAQDRRMNSLMLTGEGQQMIAAIRSVTAAISDDLFIGIDNRDRETFFDVMSHLFGKLAGREVTIPEEDGSY